QAAGQVVTAIRNARAAHAARRPRDASRLRDLLMQSPVGIVVNKGPDHRLELANPRFLEMAGRTHQEVIGKPILEAWPEFIGTPLMDILDRVYRTGEPFVADEYRQERVNRKGRIDEAYFKFNVVAILEPDASISGVMATIVEVTELVRARQRAEAL